MKSGKTTGNDGPLTQKTSTWHVWDTDMLMSTKPKHKTTWVNQFNKTMLVNKLTKLCFADELDCYAGLQTIKPVCPELKFKLVFLPEEDKNRE